MSERIEQTFWIHTSPGLIITLPPESSRTISSSIGKKDIPKEESERLRIITEDPIIKKRCREGYYTQDYMNLVNSQWWIEHEGKKVRVKVPWREELYVKAEQISCRIIEESRLIGKNEIAVVLFGSVAKFLSRPKPQNGDNDPSNLDIVVVGEFTESETEELLNRICSYRKKLGYEICNNVGVFIQTPDKLRNCNYSPMINYIGSSSRVLHDPYGLWRLLESEALIYSYAKYRSKTIRSEIHRLKRQFFETSVDLRILECNLRNYICDLILREICSIISNVEQSVCSSPFYNESEWRKLRERIICSFPSCDNRNENKGNINRMNEQIQNDKNNNNQIKQLALPIL